MSGPGAPKPDAGFRHLRDEAIHQGAVVTFVDGWFAAPDGQEFRRDIVRHPGAASAVAVVGDLSGPAESLEVFLVCQYRAPVDDELWEIPAGKLDVAGESPVEAVRRELAEEIGMAASHLEPLLEFLHSPGFCDELQHIFLASGLEPVPTQLDGLEEEHMAIRSFPFLEAVAMACDGRITDGKSIAGLLAAARRLGV